MQPSNQITVHLHMSAVFTEHRVIPVPYEDKHATRQDSPYRDTLSTDW